MEKKPKGRRPGAGIHTKDTIAKSALRIFAQFGYDRATIRGIAADAGVDPSLVMQYFKSKQELFTETMVLPPAVLSLRFVVQNIPRERWGTHIAGVLTQPGPQNDFMTQMTGVVRLATSDMRSADMIRTIYTQYFLAELSHGEVTNPAVRATMLASLLIGMIYTENIIGVAADASAHDETHRTLLAHVIQSILTAPIPQM
jgi:AcrR family transcriptional regulator